MSMGFLWCLEQSDFNTIKEFIGEDVNIGIQIGINDKINNQNKTKEILYCMYNIGSLNIKTNIKKIGKGLMEEGVL